MTCSTTKKLMKPLKEPEREFHKRRRAVWRQHQNESLAIAGRNLFEDEASSSTNDRVNSLSEEEGWDRIEEYVQYQDDLWDDPPPSRNISSISEIIKPTFEWRAHEADEWNSRQKKEGEKGPKWVVKSKFEDDLSGFMLKKSFHAKGLGEMLNQHRRGMHEQFSQILTAIGKSRTPTSKTDPPTFSIMTRSGTSTRDPPYLTPPRTTTVNPIERTLKRGIPEVHDPTVVRNKETSQSPTFYHPYKSSSVPFPSRLKEQKKDDNDEWLLSIFRQIHINLPFLEVMIHMPKGAKVLKDLLSHKEKLKKAATSVKLSEECLVVVQRSLPQKDGDPGSFTLPFFEIDEDDLVPIILGRPFLATAHAVIDVHEGKLSLGVRSKTFTFNIEKSMKSKYSRDDYLYCADHTAKLIREQWMDTVNHDGKWNETEEEQDPKEVHAVFVTLALFMF
ncbi:hypothetical protein Tco_1330107 [Tanacetum coccineum]